MLTKIDQSHQSILKHGDVRIYNYNGLSKALKSSAPVKVAGPRSVSLFKSCDII